MGNLGMSSAEVACRHSISQRRINDLPDEILREIFSNLRISETGVADQAGVSALEQCLLYIRLCICDWCAVTDFRNDRLLRGHFRRTNWKQNLLRLLLLVRQR